MIKLLKSPLYLLFEPNSKNEKSIAFEVTTVGGLDEVSALVKQRTGHVHFIDLREFLQYECAERITDDCTEEVGMAWNTDYDSVFYIFIR
jgi:hypothetical protein